MMQTRQL